MRGANAGHESLRPSRRDVLAGACGAVAAATVVAPRVADAQSETSRDVRMLNGLLANEYAAVQAYEACADVLLDAGSDDPFANLKPVALAVAARFSAHHHEHATQLAAVLRGAAATPITYDDVRFTMPSNYPPSIANAIRILANVERRASVLYTRALGSGDSRLAAQLIASIGGVQTQHFIVLSLLAQGIVAPTDATVSLANEIVPAAFVIQTAPETSGLERVADFEFE